MTIPSILPLYQKPFRLSQSHQRGREARVAAGVREEGPVGWVVERPGRRQLQGAHVVLCQLPCSSNDASLEPHSVDVASASMALPNSQDTACYMCTTHGANSSVGQGVYIVIPYGRQHDDQSLTPCHSKETVSI